MEILIENACGLDVHKGKIVACIIGKGFRKEIRSYTTMTNDLLDMKKWLKEKGITHVAMESTGIYWKPVYNILEDGFIILLVNAKHIKKVPGRKTDVKDSEWICKLLRAGLLNKSFVPPQDVRELRDLTRYRKKLVDQITAEKNRIQKVLEDANIKLSEVISDIFAGSGMKMLNAIIEGERDPEVLCKLGSNRLKATQKELKEALTGYITKHHIFMLQSSFNHIESIEKIKEDIDFEIEEKMSTYSEEYNLIQDIPGIKEVNAASIIAEIGADMEQFPTEKDLASWAGVSPGNNESAGKKKVVKFQKGINI